MIAFHASDTLLSASSIVAGVPSAAIASIVAVVSPSPEIPFSAFRSFATDDMSPLTRDSASLNAMSAEFVSDSISLAVLQSSSLAAKALYTLHTIVVASWIDSFCAFNFFFADSFNSSTKSASCSPIRLILSFPASRALAASSTVFAALILSIAAAIASSANCFCAFVS